MNKFKILAILLLMVSMSVSCKKNDEAPNFNHLNLERLNITHGHYYRSFFAGEEVIHLMSDGLRVDSIGPFNYQLRGRGNLIRFVVKGTNPVGPTPGTYTAAKGNLFLNVMEFYPVQIYIDYDATLTSGNRTNGYMTEGQITLKESVSGNFSEPYIIAFNLKDSYPKTFSGTFHGKIDVKL